METQLFTTNTYFLGEQVLDKGDKIQKPTSLADCSEMIRNKNVKGIGRLTRIHPNIYATSNKFKPKYGWMREIKTVVSNVYLEYTHIYYDFFNGQIISGASLTSHCNFFQNYCILDNSILMWTASNFNLCSLLSSSHIFTGPSQLHYNTSGTLSKIEVKHLSMTFVDFGKAPTNIVSCLPDNPMTFITTEDFVISLNNCSLLNHKYPPQPFPKSFNNVHPEAENHRMNFIMSEEVQFLYDNQVRQIQKLETELDFMQCQNNRHNQFQYRLLSKLYPSDILQFFLKRPAAAISSGNLLRELQCKTVSASLNPSLVIDQYRFATRPLAIWREGNTSQLIQYVTEQYWSTTIGHYTSHRTHGYSTFVINGNAYTYLNATLISQTVPINALHVSAFNLSVKFPDYNFNLPNVFLSHDAVSDDFSALAATVNELSLQSSIIHDNLFETTNPETYENSSSGTSYLSRLSKIHNPFQIAFLQIMHLLSSAWALLLTIGAAIFIYKKCKTKKFKNVMAQSRNRLPMFLQKSSSVNNSRQEFVMPEYTGRNPFLSA